MYQAAVLLLNFCCVALFNAGNSFEHLYHQDCKRFYCYAELTLIR